MKRGSLKLPSLFRKTSLVYRRRIRYNSSCEAYALCEDNLK